MNWRLIRRLARIVLSAAVIVLLCVIAWETTAMVWHAGREIAAQAAVYDAKLGKEVSLLAWLAVPTPVLFLLLACMCLCDALESPDALRRRAAIKEHCRAQARADRIRHRPVTLPHR